MKFKIVYSSQLMNTDFNIENPKAEAYLTQKLNLLITIYWEIGLFLLMLYIQVPRI